MARAFGLEDFAVRLCHRYDERGTLSGSDSRIPGLFYLDRGYGQLRQIYTHAEVDPDGGASAEKENGGG
jgi:hypothetical protein